MYQSQPSMQQQQSVDSSSNFTQQQLPPHMQPYSSGLGQQQQQSHGAHRFNPNAPAFFTGGASMPPTVGSAFGEVYSSTPGMFPAPNAAGQQPCLDPSLMQQQQQQQYARGYAAGGGMFNGATVQPPRAAVMHSANASIDNSFDSSASTSNTPTTMHAAPKARRNNPYASSNASTSEPTSPAMAPSLAPASSRVPADAASSGAAASYASNNVSPPVFNPTTGSQLSSGQASAAQSPVYASEATYDASAHPIAFSIGEQFAQARGSLAATACTPRGRHMLVGAMRQQHADKIQAIYDELVPNIATIALDTNGGHVLRTLIDFLNEQQVAGLVEYLTADVVLTVATTSQNTRRVLQAIFERHHSPALQPVVNTMATHAIALATTQQGCIAVMRCIEHSTESQKQQMIVALTPQLAALTMDPYGNYVVQSVLQYFPRETSCEVIEKAFAGHWVPLSCNKFASNVMEKFIQAATPMTRKTIIEELVLHTENLAALMQDGFGNFVLQQIIDTCTTGTEFRKISDKVRPQLSGSPFGHKIEAKLKSKRFGPPYDGNHPPHAQVTTTTTTTTSTTASSAASTVGKGEGQANQGPARRSGNNKKQGNHPRQQQQQQQQPHHHREGSKDSTADGGAPSSFATSSGTASQRSASGQH